jgi:hypothetical protein
MTPTSNKARLTLHALEQRDVPAGFVLSAPLEGEASVVRVLDGTTGALKAQFDAYPGFTGGLNVAGSDDRNGDGRPDRIAIGTKSGPGVAAVYDGATFQLLQVFVPFTAGYDGPVSVAFADVNGNRTPDLVTGTGSGFSLVNVYDGNTGGLSRSFFAFGAFNGGVNVSGGDVNRDGFDDILVGAATQALGYGALDGRTQVALQLKLFGAIDGGTKIAGGDLDRDGDDDILIGVGAGGPPVIGFLRGTDGAVLRVEQVFESGYFGGVEVEVYDVSGNGRDDVLFERRGGGGSRFRTIDDDGPFHDINDDNGGNGVSGGDISGTKLEGTVTAVNAGAGQVTIRLQNGTTRTVAQAAGAKVERNDLSTTLAAFKIGDRGEAIIGTNGLALKVEAEGP